MSRRMGTPAIELGDYVAEFGAEIALPIARSHCIRYQQSFDDESGYDMFWAGAVVSGSVRAVCALAPVDETSLFVSGIFTDGSMYEYKAAKMIADRLNQIPDECALYGRLHLPTLLLRRLFRKNGWELMQGVA